MSAFTSSCQHTPTPTSTAAEPEKKAQPPRPELPRSEDANDAGRYLAGLPGRDASPFKELESEEAWREHGQVFDVWWSKWKQSTLPGMQEFQRSELSAPEITKAAVFYPFGGPDVQNLLTFYPDNDQYLMVGLEPAGAVPVKRMGGKPIASQLPGVRESLESLLRRSFFITREMDRQLRGQVTEGVLPVMLVQLVRNGYKVLGAAPITLAPEGEPVLLKPGEKSERNRGIAIDFQKEGEQRVRRLCYISLNLENKRLDQNQPFLNHLKQYGKLVSYFKSTSYMPHQDRFSTFRDAVLDRSTLVVQDDSGIPYRLFDQTKWNVQLYGDYERPYGSFRYLQQKDLLAAYQNPSAVKKLQFRIGYGFSKIPSNLLVARRKG